MPSRSFIDRCIDKEAAAWGELISTHRKLVLRLLVRTGGSDAAEDLEQEVWSKLLANRCEALRSLGQVEPANLRAFICRTAINVALDHRRRQTVRKVVQSGPLEELAGDLADTEEPVDLRYERVERQQMIFSALDEILTPPNQDRDRMIFRAHYQDGLTASEIAAMGVGLQPKGVETLLFRMASRVRALLRSKKEDAA